MNTVTHIMRLEITTCYDHIEITLLMNKNQQINAKKINVRYFVVRELFHLSFKRSVQYKIRNNLR